MLRLVLLLLVVAGVAAFFTRPDEPAMRAAADAVLSERTQAALGDLDLGGMLESGRAELTGNRTFNNYFVVSRYVVTLDNTPVVTCWGAFTQVQCDQPAEAATAA